MSNTITIGYAKFWIDTNDILYCQFINSETYYKLDLVSVKLYIEAIKNLCNGKAMPFIIDLRGIRGTFSAEAASYFSKSPILKALIISEAFIVDTINTKLSITSYKRIYDPNISHAVFNEIAPALQYCLETKNRFHGSN